MNEYFIRFWTTSGTICGMTVYAYSIQEAQNFVASLPNYSSLASSNWV